MHPLQFSLSVDLDTDYVLAWTVLSPAPLKQPKLLYESVFQLLSHSF